MKSAYAEIAKQGRVSKMISVERIDCGFTCHNMRVVLSNDDIEVVVDEQVYNNMYRTGMNNEELFAFLTME